MSDYRKPIFQPLYSDDGSDLTPQPLGITFVLGPVAVVAGAVAAAVAAAGAAAAYNVVYAAELAAQVSEVTWSNAE